MKRVLTEEEILMEKEGHGRFSLRQSAEIHPVAPEKRTRRGPRAVITNRSTRAFPDEGFDRTRYRPKLTKDAMGNNVRIMVQVK